MNKVITATGKEYDSDYFVTLSHPQQAYFRILNTPIDVVAKVFSDPSETTELYCGDYYIKGYTKLVVIIPENTGIRVAVAKE